MHYILSADGKPDLPVREPGKNGPLIGGERHPVPEPTPQPSR